MKFPCHDIVVLNSVRQKYTVVISLVVKLSACFFHIVMEDYLCLCFYVRLFIIIFELVPLYNRIRKFLCFVFSLQVFIHPCSISE